MDYSDNQYIELDLFFSWIEHDLLGAVTFEVYYIKSHEGPQNNSSFNFHIIHEGNLCYRRRRRRARPEASLGAQGMRRAGASEKHQAAQSPGTPNALRTLEEVNTNSQITAITQRRYRATTTWEHGGTYVFLMMYKEGRNSKNDDEAAVEK
ncbi:hypothetical protein Micbo1qcDRAFT_173424 [Microdochium bolleyi]|uniref:Uncharacterized protein n=1 Tax=Microdochium bolleyi TaxID=196109 RepID=A0A136JBU8_9PEZI|nr:hypothetical protein Micbo1qcDRAFT_173424 [Microdochium bolleyi]